MVHRNALLVFVKAPIPGKCKTRLTPPFTPEESAELYKCFCQDIINEIKKTEADLWIAYDPSPPFLTPEWLHKDIPFFTQHSGTLGERLIHGFQTLFNKGYKRVITIGSDAPSLPSQIIQEAIESLDHKDSVFGPAEDGGYYLVGLSHLKKTLFQNIPWSTEKVLIETKTKLKQNKMSYKLLKPHYDIDSIQEVDRLLEDVKKSNEFSSMKITSKEPENFLKEPRPEGGPWPTKESFQALATSFRDLNSYKKLDISQCCPNTISYLNQWKSQREEVA